MMVAKLTEPVASEAMSGFSLIAAPRSSAARPRPPVENWMIMPGQCLRMPACTSRNRLMSELDLPSRSRTWRCTRLAPASKASCVLSTCSAGWIGTAGFCALLGWLPVIATVMIAGVLMPRIPVGLKSAGDGRSEQPPHIERRTRDHPWVERIVGRPPQPLKVQGGQPPGQEQRPRPPWDRALPRGLQIALRAHGHQPEAGPQRRLRPQLQQLVAIDPCLCHRLGRQPDAAAPRVEQHRPRTADGSIGPPHARACPRQDRFLRIERYRL